MYSDKIAEGKGAYLLEQNKSDFLTLYVGIYLIFSHLLPRKFATKARNKDFHLICVRSKSRRYSIFHESFYLGNDLRFHIPLTSEKKYSPKVPSSHVLDKEEVDVEYSNDLSFTSELLIDWKTFRFCVFADLCNLSVPLKT